MVLVMAGLRADTACLHGSKVVVDFTQDQGGGEGLGGSLLDLSSHLLAGFPWGSP